jgi:hypothetical protein
MVEILLVALLMGAIALVFAQFLSPMLTFFQRSTARQQANSELRICMDTMEIAMMNGKASTLIISTPATTPTVQFSKAEFTSVDGSSYTITWSMTPPNSVHLQKTQNGVTNDTVLSTHVTNLNFGVNINDPGVVIVTLQVRYPLNSSGRPDSFFTITLPTRVVRMMPA